MTIDEELEVRCLISDIAHCDYRMALKHIFGYDIPTKCPYRRVLNAAFEQHLSELEHEKYRHEYPDE